MAYQFITTNDDVNLIENTFNSVGLVLGTNAHIFWCSERFSHPLVTKELPSIGSLYLGTNCAQYYYAFQCASYGNITCSNFTSLEEAIRHLLTVGFTAIVGVQDTKTKQKYLFCDLAKQPQLVVEEENVLLLQKSYEYLKSCEGKHINNACQCYKVSTFWDLPKPRCLYPSSFFATDPPITIDSSNGDISPTSKEEELYIEIDCEPGPMRPGDHFDEMCKTLELELHWFGEPTKWFGQWTWNVKKEYINEYKNKNELVGKYLKNLYDSGECRYASW